MIRDPLSLFLKDFAEDKEIVFEWEVEEETESKSLKGIFDDSFVDAATGETVLDTTQPRVTCLAEDALTIPREAVTTIRGKAYSVTKIQPDGTGMAIIQLAHEP
jgi:hypothetical protein